MVHRAHRKEGAHADRRDQAEILRLRYAECWGYSQIARHLGIHRESVRKVALRRSVALAPAAPAPRTTVVTPFRARIQALLTETGAPRGDDFPAPPGGRLPGRHQRAPGRRAPARRAPRRRRSATLTFGRARPRKSTGASSGDVFGIGRAVHAFVLVLCYSDSDGDLHLQPDPSRPSCAATSRRSRSWAGWSVSAGTITGNRGGRARAGSSASTRASWPTRGITASGPWPATWAKGREGPRRGRDQVPPHELLAGAHVPGSRGSECPSAGVAGWDRQPARAPGDPEAPALLVAEERPALLPLGEPYDTDEVRSVVVPPDLPRGLRMATATRSPGAWWASRSQLRADAETVTCWYGTHRVARHARCWRRGVEVVLPAHADGLLATKPGAQGALGRSRPCKRWAPPPRSTWTASEPAPARCGRTRPPACSSQPSTVRRAVEAALAACLAQAIVGSHQGRAVAPAPGHAAGGPAALDARGSPAERPAGAPQPAAVRCAAPRPRTGGPRWHP